MHDLLKSQPRRLSVLLALLSMALFPLRGGAAAPVTKTTAVPLGVEIQSGTCLLETDAPSGNVEPITADPEQDLVNGGIYGQKKLTLTVSDCYGVGGGTLRPVVTVSGDTLNDLTNVPSVNRAVLFRDDGVSEVQYAGFVLNKSPGDTSWNTGNFYAAGDDIEFGPQGTSCTSGLCSAVVLYVSLACGNTTDCKTNFTPESNTGKLQANVTFTFAYK